MATSTEKVTIKVLEDPTNPKLKMKYVGAIEYATPKTGKDGKTITGYDENAVEILQIEDKTKRDALQKKIKKEREELERLLGVDLSPASSFWDTFFIALGDEELALDPTNAMDRLRERFLVANRYVAPCKEDIEMDEDYHGCIFYMFREEEETSKNVAKQQLKDKASGKLWMLNEENPNKLKLVASVIFGYNAKADISAGHAYEKLTEYLNEGTEKQKRANVENFLAAVEKSPEELAIKLIVDKAVKRKVITFKASQYRHGDTTLGSDLDEVINTLSLLEMSSELGSIKKKVENT